MRLLCRRTFGTPCMQWHRWIRAILLAMLFFLSSPFLLRYIGSSRSHYARMYPCQEHSDRDDKSHLQWCSADLHMAYCWTKRIPRTGTARKVMWFVDHDWYGIRTGDWILGALPKDDRSTDRFRRWRVRPLNVHSSTFQRERLTERKASCLDLKPFKIQCQETDLNGLANVFLLQSIKKRMQTKAGCSSWYHF